MEILLFFVLFFSVNYGMDIYQSDYFSDNGTLYLSGNQTWKDAYNDSICSMLDLTVDFDDNIAINITNSNVLDSHQMAWVGAYTKRVWINFERCSYVRFKSNINGRELTTPGDPAKECLLYCNFSRFVLTENRCVCFKDVLIASSGCLAGECSDTNCSYCGKGTFTNDRNITFNCSCVFSMEQDYKNISGDGDCLAAHDTPYGHFFAQQCSQKYKPLCYDPTTLQVYLIGTANNWMRSLSDCYEHNKQFANRTTNWIGNHYGIYWVGGFSVSYNQLDLVSSLKDSCIAVNITDRQLTPVLVQCDNLLPAVCVKHSDTTTSSTEPNIIDTQSMVTITQYSVTDQSKDTLTTQSVIPSTSDGQTATNNHEATFTTDQQTTSPYKGDTSNERQQTTPGERDPIPQTSPNTISKQPRSLSDRSEESSVPVIAGSVVGGVVIVVIIVIVVLLLRRRGVFSKDTKNSGRRDGIEMKNADKVYNSKPEVICQPDNVYNHLGELNDTQNISGEDLYYHTGVQSDTYGRLHKDNGQYDDGSEYDHTFNHTASGTYGHLNIVHVCPHGDDDEYDHTFTGGSGDTYGRLFEGHTDPGNDDVYDHTNNTYGRLHAGKRQDGDDVYDHTNNTYGRLHAGKRQDVDDVYDHTGELGSTYGHIDRSEYPVEVEGEYSRISHT